MDPPARPTRLVRAALFGVALAVAGCGSSPPSPPPTDSPVAVSQSPRPSRAITPSPAPSAESSPTPAPEPGREVVANAEVHLDNISAEFGDYLLRAPPEDDYRAFVTYVFNHTDRFWTGAFAASGVAYFSPTLRIIDGPIQDGCGVGYPSGGPYYCPNDRAVVMPLPYLSSRRFDEPGDFSLAYVVAHEMGHHVQNMAGLTTARLAAQIELDIRDASSGEAMRQLTIGGELQADCLAGVWARAAHNQGELSEGDVSEATALAWDLGSDPQDRSPEADHGTRQQRADWFMAGFNSGQGTACKTFGSDIAPVSREESKNLIRLLRFFAYIDLKLCRTDPIDPQVGIIAAMSCPPLLTGTGLQLVDSWFYYYESPRAAAADMAKIRALPGTTSTRWWYGTDQANPQGDLIQWVDSSGVPWLAWSHQGVGMVGNARIAFGDSGTLYHWWSLHGSLNRGFTR